MARLGRRQPNRPIVRRGAPAVAGGGRTPPTLSVPAKTPMGTTTSPKTMSLGGTDAAGTLAWSTGDRVVVLGVTANSTTTINTPTVTGLTFAAFGSPATAGNACWAQAWEAIAASSGSGKIQAASAGVGDPFGIIAWVVSGSDGLAGSTARGIGVDALTQSLTRTADESAVVEIIGDWGAVPVTGHVWTPTGSTEHEAVDNGNAYATYAASWADQDAAGTTSYGLSTSGGYSPSGTNYTKVAVEVLGTAAAGVGGAATGQQRTSGTTAAAKATTGAASGQQRTTGTAAAAKQTTAATAGPQRSAGTVAAAKQTTGATQAAQRSSGVSVGVKAGVGAAAGPQRSTGVAVRGAPGAGAGTQAAQRTSGTSVGVKAATGAAAGPQRAAGVAATRKQAAAAAAAGQRPSGATTGFKASSGATVGTQRVAGVAATIPPPPSGTARGNQRTSGTSTGRKGATTTAAVGQQHTSGATTGTHRAIGGAVAAQRAAGTAVAAKAGRGAAAGPQRIAGIVVVLPPVVWAQATATISPASTGEATTTAVTTGDAELVLAAVGEASTH